MKYFEGFTSAAVRTKIKLLYKFSRDLRLTAKTIAIKRDSHIITVNDIYLAYKKCCRQIL